MCSLYSVFSFLFCIQSLMITQEQPYPATRYMLVNVKKNEYKQTAMLRQHPTYSMR